MYLEIAQFKGIIDDTTELPSQVFNMVLLDFNLPVGESHTFAGLFNGRNKLCSTKIEIIVWMMVRFYFFIENFSLPSASRDYT